MERLYRISLVSLLYNLLIMTFGVFVVFLIFGIIGGYKKAIIASSIIVILAVLSLFRATRQKVIVNDDRFTIYDKKKRFSYRLNEVQLSSQQRNNDAFTLYVKTENGHTESFDLSYLGFRKYHKLLEDLAVIGEKSPIIKLQENH